MTNQPTLVSPASDRLIRLDYLDFALMGGPQGNDPVPVDAQLRFNLEYHLKALEAEDKELEGSKKRNAQAAIRFAFELQCREVLTAEEFAAVHAKCKPYLPSVK